VRFTMTRQGAVVATRVEKPSGHEVLDIEGSDLVRRAQPLPAPPADMPGEQIEVIVPINFNLH
jgi:protein TonB